MFYYTSLFIATLILAAIVLWLYRKIVGVGKVVYQAILPSSKSGPADHLDREVMRTSTNSTPTPWGWGGNAKPSHAARTTKIAQADTVPWGWKGSDKVIRDHGPGYSHANQAKSSAPPAAKPEAKSQIGWPYREDKFEFAGKAYKVTRKAAPRKTNLSTTGKPWGW